MLGWIRNIFLLIIAGLAAAPWWPVIEEWRTGATYRDYLAANAHPVDLNTPGGGLSLPADFYDNRLFLVGEIHGMQTAQAVDLALMQHLHATIGLRHIMAELDATQADRINTYLATGDEAHIRPIFDAWLGNATQWGNQQHFEKLQDLAAWNATLQANERIVYFGVDAIHDMDNALDWFASRLAAEDASPALADLAVVLNGDRTDTAALAVALVAAQPALNDDLAYMAENILADFDGAGRYARIEPNITAMVDRFGIGDDEPVYGFWGLFHSLSATVNGGARPLALRLRESDLPFADDIVTLTMSYANSQQNMPSRMLPEALQPDGPFFDAPGSQDNPYLMYLNGIGDMKAVAGDQPATLFRLNSEGSPYAGGVRMASQTGLLTYVFRFEMDPFDGFASDYAILIQDAPALTAFEG